MLAKYRPPMPIMTLVVPYLKNEGLKWSLEGRSVARQALLISGLLPVLAAPTPSGELAAPACVGAAGNPCWPRWFHGLQGICRESMLASLSPRFAGILQGVPAGLAEPTVCPPSTE